MKIRKRNTGSYSYWQLDKGLVNGKRVRLNFKTKGEAEGALTAARGEKGRLGSEAMALPHSVRVAMLDAQKRLQAAGASITQAVDFFLRYHQQIPDMRLDVAIVGFLRAKRAANLRPRYLRQVEFVLNRFALGREDRLVKEIMQPEVEEWINGNGWAPKTRRGYLTDLQTFFGFCARSGWVIEDPAVKIQKPRLDEGRPAILTAEQSSTLMLKAHEIDPALCGYLALALFGGVRPEEIERLPVKAVDLKAGVIRIPAEVSKTRRERDVTIEPNLKAWLRLGIELPVVNFKKRFDRVRKAAGLFDDWKHDVMRHTYGSMHVAKYQSVGRAAIQMGNSEPIVKAHYLDHVRDSKAVAAFWKIVPQRG